MKLNDLIMDFLEYSEHEVGCTQKTLNNYKYTLLPFSRRIGDVSVSEINIDDLNNYFRQEESRGIAISSVNASRSVIRLLFRYVSGYRNIYLNFDPSFIRAKRVSQSTRIVARKNDVEAVLKALHDVQDKLMVLLLNQTCMRIGELVRLNVEDINGTEIRVMGKNRRYRFVYVQEDLADALLKYLTENKIHSGPVFRHPSKTSKGQYERYTVSGLRNRFIRRLEPKGLHAGFHWYRRGGATDMMRNGASLYFLKEYLGHSDIRTTVLYVQMNDQEKHEMFDYYYHCPVDIKRVLTKH